MISSRRLRLFAAPLALILLLLVAPSRFDAVGAGAAGSSGRVTLCVVVHYDGTNEHGSTQSLPKALAERFVRFSPSYYGPCAVYGPASALGQGSVRTFAQIEDRRPVTVGISFSPKTLTDLPTAMTDGLRCFDVNGDGVVQEMTECAGGHERPLQFPAAFTSLPDVPFKWALVNWNPHGHGPPGIYQHQHFDFHFYTQPKAERDAIRVGPCGIVVNCDDFATGTVPIPASNLPSGYTDNGSVEGLMGNHLVDLSGEEWSGHPFVKTFIYGAYNGKLTFLEPMITKAWLEKVGSGAEPSGCFPINQPAAWAVPGWYPTVYCTKFHPKRGEYVVTMENFRHS